MAAHIVVTGLVSEAAAAGHALRREWWPIGAMCLVASVRRSRLAQLGTCCMLAPIALEWLRNRPEMDPARYALLRLVEDAAYGSGVLVSAVRRRTFGPLKPEVRFPRRRHPV